MDIALPNVEMCLPETTLQFDIKILLEFAKCSFKHSGIFF